MLSSQLEDQLNIDEFVKTKTDREIAVTGLLLFNSHVKECAERWAKVYWGIKALGVGLGLIIFDRIANEFPPKVIAALHELASGILGH